MRHIRPVVLQATVGSISLEAANARHEHEWAHWADAAERGLIPDDLVLVPGAVGHDTNLIEHPDLGAKRIERFTRMVGPDRVVASTD